MIWLINAAMLGLFGLMCYAMWCLIFDDDCEIDDGT